MMNKTEAKLVIINALNHIRDSITSDWLHYCVDKDVDFEILEDKEISYIIKLRDGVPAVGRILVVDNDFFELQSKKWQEENRLLCQKGFVIVIEKIIDVKLVNDEDVKVFEQDITIKFCDPS